MVMLLPAPSTEVTTTGPVPCGVTILPSNAPETVAVPAPLLTTVRLPSGLVTLVDPLPVSVNVLSVSKPVMFTGLVPLLSSMRLPTGVTILVAPLLLPLPVLLRLAPLIRPVMLMVPVLSLSAVRLLCLLVASTVMVPGVVKTEVTTTSPLPFGITVLPLLTPVIRVLPVLLLIT